MTSITLSVSVWFNRSVTLYVSVRYDHACFLMYIQSWTQLATRLAERAFSSHGHFSSASSLSLSDWSGSVAIERL